MPASSENMVRFGLRNVHYATFSDSTYATPKPIKGAVQLTTSPEGDSYTFYADDVAYYATETNGGYTGTIEVAAVNDEFLKDVLGYKSDTTSGLLYEATTTVVPSVALLFEVSGNVEQQRGIFYNVNVPNVPTAELRGVKLARKGKRRYHDKITVIKTPFGGEAYWVGGRIEDDMAEDTDVFAVAHGFASVTPVHLEMTSFAALEKISALDMEREVNAALGKN